MWGAMADLEPASALALRLPWRTHEELTALIEADRAAVREAALREAIAVTREALRVCGRQYDELIANAQKRGYHADIIRGHRREKDGAGVAIADVELQIEKLLTEKRTHG
jgi:DNA-binding winged helix-turn-helix (wHTH) protein